MGNSAGKNYLPKHSGTGSNSKKVHWGSAALPAPPGKPILVPVSTEDTQPDVVGIRWERSPSNGGSAIVGYQVEHRRLGSPYWVRSSPSLCTFPELTLSGLEPGWRYQFRVRARNGLGLSEPSELSDPLTVTLQRSVASAPRFDLELKDTVALENDQADFTVHFSGTPLPKISWFKDGFEIFSSRRTRIITENGKSQLLIHQTALNDEGEIKCTATNRAGHVSTKAKLVLEAPPKIRLPRQYEDGLLFEQDETIRLKVSVAGRPLPTVTWYHDNEIVAADPGHILETSEIGESALKITAAKRKDRGEYTVKATNKLGEDVASFLVTVTDRPSATGKATIAMTLGRSVTLTWNEPEDDGGCKIGTYIVEYYRIGWDMWLKAATCRQPTTTLTELIEGSEYRFRVKAENPYGVSDPSEESEVVFIPDPKRGINSPPKRPDKTQSQHEIRRGRGAERRDENFSEPAKRTRSLTREEAVRGASGDGFEGGPPTRSASAHRLPGGPIPPARPSRADSRVTFADTVYLHVEKPLEDSSTPTRPKTKRDKNPNLGEDAESASAKKDKVPPESEKMDNSPKIVAQPSFDDSGGRNSVPKESNAPASLRGRSMSPLSSSSSSPKVQNLVDSSKTIEPPKKPVSPFLDPSSPRESLDLEDDEERLLRGSSEFMLVLYPDENPNSQNGKSNVGGDLEFLEKSRLRPTLSEGDAEEENEEEDLVAPPMSLSLPELFSANHQVVEVLREAVSSTELLHERAMERFYRAVALEEAELAKKNEGSAASGEKQRRGGSPLDIEVPSLSPSSMRLRNTRLRRRPSSSGSPVQGGSSTKIAWNRRRSSEGQTTITKAASGLPATLLLPTPELIASDPYLSKHEAEVDQLEFPAEKTSNLPRDFESPLGKVPAAEHSSLHHWDEKSMPLVPAEREKSEKTESEIPERPRNEPLFETSNLVRVNRAAELYEMESEEELEDEEEEEEESDSSEDLKLLKSRILAQPVVDEEDTYHPRGRPIPHVGSPEPAPSQPADHRGPMTPTSVNQQPKSILKKRTEEDPIPVNRFGRPIPPEMPLPERQQRRNDDNDALDEPTADNGVTMRKKSLNSMPEAMRNPLLSEMDKDNATLLSTAEAARSRRRMSSQAPALPTKTSFEEEEDLQARMAVIDHYTEIVREYSLAHSVHPPMTYQRSNTSTPSQEQPRKLPSFDSFERSESDRGSSVSPMPIMRRDVSMDKQVPGPASKKEDVVPGSRKNSVGSRGTTPAKETKTTREPRAGRRSSRTESPGPRSRNVSTERSTAGSRSSSRTRNREVSQDRNSAASGTIGRRKNREKSKDRSGPGSRSSSKTRNRETSQERPASRLKKERSVSQTRTSSRANSRDRHKNVDQSPSDSEASSRLSGRKKNDVKKLERSGRSSVKARRASAANGENRNNVTIVDNKVDERIVVDVTKKVRSTMSYATDLTLLVAAIYVYLFKKEILAVPLIGLLLYRRIQEDVHSWIPKRWKSTTESPKR